MGLAQLPQWLVVGEHPREEGLCEGWRPRPCSWSWKAKAEASCLEVSTLKRAQLSDVCSTCSPLGRAAHGEEA